MGCTASNPDDGGGGGGGGGGRVFEVANIDDSGQERSCGKLEVTTSDLVLYYPGARDAVRWPFPSLRRYGFNDHLFSFESGRRCPSGHGIYAFRCSRAEQLFRQLQESIAKAGQERSRSLVAETGSTEVQTRNPGVDPQTADQTNSHLDRIDPRFTDYINEANFTESWRRYVNHQTTTSDPREVSAMTPVQCQPIGTMNRQSTSSSCHARRPSFPSTARDNVIQYAQLDLPMELVDYDEEAEVFQTPEVGSVAGHFRSPPTYVNVPLTAMKARVEQRPLVAALTYAQLDLGEVDASAAAADGGSGSSSCAEGAAAATAAAAAAATATVPRRSGGKCEFPSSSREKPEIYARIDFRRTIALSTSTTSETEDEGFRKTRHNSNIETLTRN